MRHWGDEDAPKLFMVHGWMDISASYQFIVDAMKRDWHVIAPDLRGFGQSEWAVGGYWFPDYLADLEAAGHPATAIGPYAIRLDNPLPV